MTKPTKLPDCPSCGDNRAVYAEPTGYYCRTCQVVFDDDPNEGGDYSSHDPSWRMQREEARAERKKREQAKRRALPPGFGRAK